MNAEAFEQWAGGIESLAMVAALFVGAAWTYLLFVRQRQRYPSAKVSQSVDVQLLDSGHYWLHVHIAVENTGRVVIPLQWIRCRVQQANPVPDYLAEKIRDGHDPVPEGQQEIGWPVLNAREWNYSKGEAEIEPGEADRLDCDFVVPPKVSCLVVYAYVKNPVKKGRELGWSDTHIVTLPKAEQHHVGTNADA